MTEKKDPDVPAATLLKHFSTIMSNRIIKAMYTKDAKQNIMRYNPHLAMVEHNIQKIFMGEILAVGESVQGLRLGMAL